MSPEIVQEIIKRISTSVDGKVVSRAEIEAGYKPRQLKTGTIATRIAPSPTGTVHIGTIYAALLNERIAHQSGGPFIVRIEDTDKKREVAGAEEELLNSFDKFNLIPDESPRNQNSYGPYVQSQRILLYLSYTIDLLQKGRAYPCFSTDDQLAEVYKSQQAAKLRPGYYGKYALWRNQPNEKVSAALNTGAPFVLRFKSLGSHEKRITFSDALKGSIELPENDLDIPLLKTDGLPTYHLAHVVDDHLMGINLVLRGDEWLPSTPLHIELADALGITPFNYAHFAPISILDNGNKRKLSKRKDPQADIKHWLGAGYPPESILEYLTYLANSNFEQWRALNQFAKLSEFQLSLAKLSMSRSPLLDTKKLEDISRNVIANFEQTHFEKELYEWLAEYDQELGKVFAMDTDYTSKVLTVEREGANRRKDLASWSKAREMYFYFFDSLYIPEIAEAIQRELEGVDSLLISTVGDLFLGTYDPLDDQPTWFNKFKLAARDAGFAPDTDSYKKSPQNYKGSLADFAKILRVKLTTKNRSPDLYTVMQVMGEPRVRDRLSS